MDTLEEVLRQIALDLSDLRPGNEFKLYPRQQLIDWWNDGLCLLCSLRPRLFSGSRVVELVDGSEQRIEGCTLISSVREQLNERGEPIALIRRISDSAVQAWLKPPICRADPNNYRITGYRYDPANRDTFYVDPPKPPGAKAQVSVTCSTCPKALTLDDLNEPLDVSCYQLAMTKHYIYSQAWGMESDQSNLNLAQWHASLWGGFLKGGQVADTGYPKPVQGSAVPGGAIQ